MVGIILGKVTPGSAKHLDGLAIYVGEAPVVSIPIAVCLFFMMYPIMVKIDFGRCYRQIYLLTGCSNGNTGLKAPADLT